MNSKEIPMPRNGQTPAPAVDPNQPVETNAYVPTYSIKPEFQQAVLKAIGKYPFNQIQAVMQAVKVDKMDHNTLTQIMNSLGSFPYESIAGLLTNINSYIDMIQPEEVSLDNGPGYDDSGSNDIMAPVAEDKPKGTS